MELARWVAFTGLASAGLGGIAAAFDIAFWWSIAFTAVAIVLALWLPLARRRDAFLCRDIMIPRGLVRDRWTVVELGEAGVAEVDIDDP